MKKIDTKKTLIIEDNKIEIIDSSLINEDFVDVDLKSGIKNLISTGLKTFANFGKQIWSSTVQFVWDYAYNRLILYPDASPEAVMNETCKTLDQRYVNYSRELDQIFESSGVADDVRMAVNLSFLPARGLNWYIGNSELNRIKTRVFGDEGKPLFNNFVDRVDPDRQSGFWQWCRFDTVRDGRNRRTETQNQDLLLVYHIYIYLHRIAGVNTGLHEPHGEWEQIERNFSVGQVRNWITSLRDNSFANYDNFRRYLYLLQTTTIQTYIDTASQTQEVREVLETLYRCSANRTCARLITQLSTQNDLIPSLTRIRRAFARIAADRSQSTAFNTDAQAITATIAEANSFSNRGFLLIENEKISFLNEEESEEEQSKEDSQEEKTSDASPKKVGEEEFAEFVKQMQDKSKECVKAEVVLYNLAKDMSFYSVVLSSYINLETFYYNTVLQLKDKNSGPDNIETVFNSVQEEIQKSYKEKEAFYNECLSKKLDEKLLPEELKGKTIISKETDKLPKQGTKINDLIKDIKSKYNIETFRKEVEKANQEQVALYSSPKAYLNEAQIKDFLDDEDSVKLYLNLYLRKNFVDILLEGESTLDDNIKKIDDALNTLTEKINKIYNELNVNNLVAIASNNENMSDRVETFKTALSSLKAVMSVLEKVEAQAKELEPLSEQLKKGIETIFNGFKNQDNQDQQQDQQDTTKSQDQDIASEDQQDQQSDQNQQDQQEESN